MKVSFELPNWVGSFWDILSNFLALYKEPWFLFAVIITFFVGQFVHVVLRAYLNQIRDVTKALIIWWSQIIVGYSAAFKMLDVPHVEQYAWITGLNSIALYFGLMWLSTKWFKWPRVATFLKLRNSKISESGEIDFGATIKLIAKGRKK